MNITEILSSPESNGKVTEKQEIEEICNPGKVLARERLQKKQDIEEICNPGKVLARVGFQIWERIE